MDNSDILKTICDAVKSINCFREFCRCSKAHYAMISPRIAQYEAGIMQYAQNVLNITMTKNDILSVELCIEWLDIPEKQYNCNSMILYLAAAAIDRIDVVKKMYNLVPLSTEIIKVAAQFGSLNTLKYLHEQNAPMEYDLILYQAIESSRLNVLDWVMSLNLLQVDDISMYVNAVNSGNIEMLKWVKAHTNRDDMRPHLALSMALGVAIKKNNINIVKWIRAEGIEWPYNSLIFALEYCDQELLNYILVNGATWPTHACKALIIRNDPHITKWALDAGCSLTEQACEAAASLNHINQIYYLHSIGAPLSEKIYDYIILALNNPIRTQEINNEFKILLLGRTNQPQKQIQTMSFDEIKYHITKLHELGCPKHADTFNCAITQNSIELLDLLFSLNFPMTLAAVEVAIEYNFKNSLIWLQSHGLSFIGKAHIAIEYNHIDLLKWMVENGAMLTEECSSNALNSGNMDILEYLYEQKCPPCCINKLFCIITERSPTIEWALNHGYYESMLTSGGFIPKIHLNSKQYISRDI